MTVCVGPARSKPAISARLAHREFRLGPADYFRRMLTTLQSLEEWIWTDADMPVDLSRVNKNSAMGATVQADGTGFRTWAPNASNVFVLAGSALAGSNDPSWRPAPEDALASLGDGSWGGFLPDVADGDPYMFFVEGAGSAGWKRDPYARELTLSPAFPDSFCVVRNPQSYSWRDQSWQPLAFNDLIIYQLHVGTWW